MRPTDACCSCCAKTQPAAEDAGGEVAAVAQQRARPHRAHAGDGTIRRYTIETAPHSDAMTARCPRRLARTPDQDVVRALVGCPDVFVADRWSGRSTSWWRSRAARWRRSIAPAITCATGGVVDVETRSSLARQIVAMRNSTVAEASAAA